MLGPVVDDPFLIDEKANAVVGVGDELVATRSFHRNLAGPANREVLRRQTRRQRLGKTAFSAEIDSIDRARRDWVAGESGACEHRLLNPAGKARFPEERELGGLTHAGVIIDARGRSGLFHAFEQTDCVYRRYERTPIAPGDRRRSIRADDGDPLDLRTIEGQEAPDVLEKNDALARRTERRIRARRVIERNVVSFLRAIQESGRDNGAQNTQDFLVDRRDVNFVLGEEGKERRAIHVFA